MSEEYDDMLDDAIDAMRDFEPSRWMQSMERVVDSYKREVEFLRNKVKALESNVQALLSRIGE